MHYRVFFVLGWLVLGACALGQEVSKSTTMVPMTDGISLATDIYLPAGKGPWPVVMLRTPYDKAGLKGLGEGTARMGYAVVIQDTRGRFASQGIGKAFGGDGWSPHQDGLDTVKWMLLQPWCNGKIATQGGSALGITQLMLAASGAPNIAVQMIDVAAPSGYGHLVYSGGVFRKAMVEDWIQLTNHSPEGLREWLAHPTYDSFWRERDVATRYRYVNSPAIHVGGWYDIFAQGTIDAFLGFQNKGGPKARGRQKLVMGPWTHGIYQEKAGELTFRNANKVPGEVTWAPRILAHYLKGEPNGADSDPVVTYYTMGDAFDPSAPGNEWRTASSWPPKSRRTAYYLHTDGSLSTQRPPRNGAPRSFTYDPGNPCPTTGGPQLTLPAGPMEQSRVEARPDVLSFTSAPLSQPLEVTGRVEAELTISSDCPDTDFVVKLCDVYPDGRSYNVCEGILRARFREGFTREVFMEPGKTYRIVVDLWSTSIVFNRGHRLRVQVTSSNAPGWDPNPNTGAPFRANSETRVARNTVHLGAGGVSRIWLPVIP